MRRAAKRDSNEQEIIYALQQIGATVEQLNDDALPDLIVGFRGENYLLEVKTSTGRLTTAQAAWWANPWNGHRAIVRNVDDALNAIGLDWEELTLDKTFCGATLGEVTGHARELGS